MGAPRSPVDYQTVTILSPASAMLQHGPQAPCQYCDCSARVSSKGSAHDGDWTVMPRANGWHRLIHLSWASQSRATAAVQD
jgi:hypothetical protein